MKLRIMTQNVQGLNDTEAPSRVRQYYKDHLKSLDVLAFHEHKLRGEKLKALSTQVWKDALFVGNEATVAYNHGPQDEEAGKGGVCMFISPKISHLVKDIGRLGSQAQWLTLVGTPSGDIGLLNVYAPNSPQERTYLWDQLVEELPPGFKWVLFGDWNMVLASVDNSTIGGNTIGGAEKVAFLSLTSHTLTYDFFNHSARIKYTWDNKRKAGQRTLKRLDRFYCFASGGPEPSSHILEYAILSDSSLSDHLPISLHMNYNQLLPKALDIK